MEFSGIFMISCSVMLLCSPLAYGQVSSRPAAMTPTPTPAPAPGPAYVNLAYLLSVAGPYRTFLNYLESTKLIDTFQNQANNSDLGITIFAPKDDAFKALKKPSLSDLSDDQLKSVILFHALPKYYALADFNDLSSKGPVSTLAGGQYTLDFTDDSGTVRLDSGWSKTKVTSAVHSTDPVAIYQVNKVLLPEAIFGTNIPPTPAPAPAIDISPAADTPSAAKSKENSSSSKSDSSSSSACRIMNSDIWTQMVSAVVGGWMVMFL
ncbi:Fasciclin-like arabinogalactan protein 7 [Hibiscus syriacus]|uniref:Fasciclin-like arabinogalactan protein 7 n=1 Tax=Hibiscus syriacus TaxID=106335 RepID=A0A6A2XM22_HIBSY|nr:fasciclin-like arabinogalactan protein 7 [Hibiscus syriacus]KAE8676843.1 Fasciclin-like arabinogalactan protein 7 [Hibiscus syriacus]